MTATIRSTTRILWMTCVGLSTSWAALTDEEFDYMVTNCRFIPQNYFEWLRGFRFDPKRISTWIDEHGHLHIEASDFMYKVTLYEIAVLTTVSTLRNSTHAADMSGVMTRLKEKIALSNAEHLLFSDFGTRRRFSFEVHRAVMEYIRRDMKEDPEGTRYCYKFDISKFYESVGQDFVMYCVRRVFKDKKLIAMLDNFVRLMPQGISIGLRSSQGLGNLLLSVFLDHYLKDKYGVRHFYRYCDDGVVLGDAKSELWKIRDAVHFQVTQIGLTVKPDERVFPVDEGIDFLGYVIYPDHVRLRKRIKQKFARKMHEVKSRKRRRELVASFYGMAKHADCNMLFNKLTGKKMRSFKDLNVSYKPEDGKKRFPGSVVSIRELVNLPIIVKDFETGIRTEQGEDRCIVAIEMNGEAKKFFTNSEEMKNILAQVSEMPDGFPFETIIRTETFGKGRTKYVFS